MSKLIFQPEQQDVLDSQGKNLIVSASAGSGKTTIMIEKIINLILKNKVNIKSVLVLTYTKLASQEMKQKLINAIYCKADKNPQLLEQIDDIPIADISTLHSFFQKILKKYFMAVDLDPSFKIIDETKARKMKADAFDLTFEKFGQKEPEKLQKLLDIYGGNRNESVVKKIIEKLSIFYNSLDNPMSWIKNTSLLLYDLNLKENKAVKIINKEINNLTKFFINKLQKLQKEYAKINASKYIENINSILSCLELVKDDNSYFIQNCNIWANLSFSTLTKVNGLEEEYKKIFDLRDDIKKFSQKIKNLEFTDEKCVKDILLQTSEIVSIICNLTIIYQENYMRLKLKNNVLDYDDLEKYMLKLLKNSVIKHQIVNGYIEIFVDEYQDANRIQEKIISQICKKNNRFMVGDVKQSIYGFRQAEPDIFLEKQNEYLNEESSEVKFLNCNFRSDENILNFVNLVFDKIMTENTAKIDYKNTSTLKGMAKYQKISGQNIPSVEINIIKSSEREKSLNATKIYKIKENLISEKSYDLAELEAFLVAKKISEIIGKKYYDASTQSEKIIDYKDITILLKVRGKYLDSFSNILSSFNIPIYANTNSSLYEDSDVQVLLNLLKLCQNSNNDIALTSVLHSVFCGFSFDELAKIRLEADSKNFSFCDCVNSYSKKDKILTKIISAKQFLNDFKFDINFNGIYKTLNKYINKYDYYSYLLTKSDGLEKTNKVNKFVSDFLINDFNFNLNDFLYYFEENKEEIKSPDFSSGENCVFITTIHSSKGLEFPIVFLVNAGQDLKKEHFSVEIKVNQKLGIGLKNYNEDTRIKKSTLPYEAINIENLNNEFAEKLRLLYVALTRAKNHLFIVGSTKNNFEHIDFDYETKMQKSYLDLIINSFPISVIDKVNKKQNTTFKNVQIKVFRDEYSSDFMEENINFAGKINEKFKEKFKNYFNFKYKYNTNIALKNTVTALNKQIIEPYLSQNLAPKSFFVNEHLGENPTEIGIIYHSIFEKINFDEINNLSDVERFLAVTENGQKVSSEVIYDCIKLLKKFDLKNVLKEQKFVMYVPHKEIVENGVEDKILIQGVIDLIILGRKNVLIDYKYTSLSDENKIISKYKTQLKLYKKAVSYAIKKEIDEVYLLLIKNPKIIKINV